MSSRTLKKVFGSQDDLKNVTPNSEDEAPVAFNTSKRTVRNPYELLNELSESEAKEDDGQADDDEQKSADSSKMDDDASQSAAKKKKKKKKPSKNKRREAAANKSVDTDLTEDEEMIRQKHKTSRVALGKSREKDHQEKPSKELALFEEMFKIDSRLLNPEYELKKIFGAKVINYERGKQGQRRIYRHNKLIAVKEQWPSSAGSGISMSYLDTKDGYLYFKYEHNAHYQEIQKQFMRAVDTLNPDNIVNVLKNHHYHIDSHIQLSDMAKSAEDMQVAAELIEGALHCMENAFHVRFNLSIPSCRLEYKYQENRAFFILLFKHLSFVGQRACHRTALELSKRLLCLDPEHDPLCVTLMIDFYAIKANEPQWLIDLFLYWEQTKNLSQLPNFAYSVALAYHLITTSANKLATAEKYKMTSEELVNKSDSMIQYAILMFPSVLLPLLDKCNVQCDSRVRNHSYFNSVAQNSQTNSLKLLCELYVWRTHHVWRDPAILSWLEKNVNAALDRVDANEPMVKDYDGKRRRRYQGTPRNILRHVLLTDNKELTVHLPTDLSKEPILNYDPLPPTDTVDIYNMRENRLPGATNTRRNGLFSMLFRSLLYDLNAQANDANLHLHLDDAAGAAGGENLNPAVAVGAGLQQSVTALLDAMRDLLSNVNPRAEGEAEAADGEDSDADADD